MAHRFTHDERRVYRERHRALRDAKQGPDWAALTPENREEIARVLSEAEPRLGEVRHALSNGAEGLSRRRDGTDAGRVDGEHASPSAPSRPAPSRVTLERLERLRRALLASLSRRSR